MFSQFDNIRNSVCVAVAFDNHAESLVRTGASLCRKTGMKLRLVHVCEPWIGTVGLGIMPVSEVSDTIQTQLMTQAESNLAELREMVADDVDTETNVALGSVADALIADATHHQAALILVNSQTNMSKFIPSGFSAALSLMGNSPIPVLAVPAGQEIDLSNSGLKAVVANDLGSSSSKVFDAALSFATALGAKLTQVHVNGLNPGNLDEAINLASAAGRSTADPALSGEDFLKAINEVIRDKMSERSAGLADIEADILSGEPAEALHEYLEQKQPDVAIFGRHCTFHRKPFLIGRVPFKAMLTSKSAILIIPPEEERRSLPGGGFRKIAKIAAATE